MLTVVTGERDELRKVIGQKGKTPQVMRIGEVSCLSQNNEQLYQQNRHLQEMVLKLASPRTEAPPL